MGGMWRSALAAVVLTGAIAAPAQATVRTGSGADPAGDAAAGGDIVEIAARSDDATGQAGIGVRLSASPTADVIGLIGTRSGAECVAPYVYFQGRPSTGIAVWARDPADTTDDFSPAQMTVSGTTVVLTAANAVLAQPFNCAIAATSSPSGSLYDETDAVTDLAADAPPAPTPTPVPSATPAPPPVIPAAPKQVVTTPPVPVAKTAKLTASLGGVPSTIRRNRTMTLKLVLTDDGSKSTGPITVTLSKPRGLSLTRSRVKVAKLKPAQKRTIKLKLRLTKRAKGSTTFKVTARSGKLKATSSVLLRIGKAKKVSGKPQKNGDVKKSPIVGTYWWRTVNHVDYAWDNRALYFVDDKTVYSGFPAGGLPASCTTPPAKPEEEIDERDGCLPYTYDAKTGALTIGDKTGSFKPGSRLQLDGNAYSALQIPAAGATFAFNEHQHVDFSGFCGLITGCTITQKFLTLMPDGQFVLSRSTTATVGDPGLGPFTAAGSYPPDQHGTYAVPAGGRIHLAFADGTARDDTFAVLTKDDTLAPDPAGEGVLIGEDNYYPDPSP